jgi:hypothetical protein
MTRLREQFGKARRFRRSHDVEIKGQELVKTWNDVRFKEAEKVFAWLERACKDSQ